MKNCWAMFTVTWNWNSIKKYCAARAENVGGVVQGISSLQGFSWIYPGKSKSQLDFTNIAWDILVNCFRLLAFISHIHVQPFPPLSVSSSWSSSSSSVASLPFYQLRNPCPNNVSGYNMLKPFITLTINLLDLSMDRPQTPVPASRSYGKRLSRDQCIEASRINEIFVYH